jgi:hypothetical protein
MVALLAAAFLTACASHPPPPDWQSNAKSAMDHALSAYLSGEARADARDFQAARAEIARTGRPELLARAELMRCAAQVASLVFETCSGYVALEPDASAEERAYARYLAAQSLSREEIARLPAAQQTAAAALGSGEPSVGGLQAIEDPLSRLIAIGVLFQAGKASPPMIALAADTASSQGWRRPLLAWLKVQAMLAQRAGDGEEAQRLARRIRMVEEMR